MSSLSPDWLILRVWGEEFFVPGIDTRDRAHCLELACSPGSVFELTHRFLSGVEADCVLALEAFFCSIRDIPARVTDPSVAMAKLSWWAEELHGASGKGSQHPVMRALMDTGMLNRLDAGGCESYLHAHLALIQGKAPETARDFMDQLSQTGGCESLIWAGLGQFHSKAVPIQHLGVASRLLDSCVKLATAGESGNRLPREWQDRFGTGRGDERAQRNPELLRHMANLALARQAQADTEQESLVQRSRTVAGARYLLIRTGVERRRLERFKAHPQRMLSRSRAGGSLADVLIAWRRARGSRPTENP